MDMKFKEVMIKCECGGFVLTRISNWGGDNIYLSETAFDKLAKEIEKTVLSECPQCIH